MKDLKRFLFSGLFLLTLACSTDEPAPAAAVPVAVSSISINNGTEIGISALSLNMGKTATLTAVVLPEDAADKTVTWSSADATIATIDAAGVITPVKEGTVIITATSAQTPAVSVQISLTVLGKDVAIVPATSISIKNGGAVITTLSLGVGGTATLTAVVLPENATNKSVTWSSADATIANINATTGVITPLKAGTVVIKATSASTTTVSASVTLTVTETNIPVTSITINNGTSVGITTLALGVGATATLTAVVLPENATNKSVSWSSSTAATATITPAGVVTAVAVGTTTITATSVSAATVVGTVTLTVVPPTPKYLIAYWASAAATAELTLSWEAVTGATSYKVYKGTVLVTTVTTGTTHTIASATATDTYTVSAVKEGIESAKASVFSTMMLIQAGTFTMGQADITNASLVHSVTLTKAYYMSKTEVTFAQYDAFCDATSRAKPDDNGFGRGTRPVINVTWDDAVAYATWISGKTGKTYLLPTEAEWEYACRAGTTTIYNTGDGLTTAQANFGGTQTVAVGSYTPNAWGLNDMHGNVWEWCSDWYGAYGSEAQTDPAGPATGIKRVNRGGGWYDSAGICRSASRYNSAPGISSTDLGFRVVVPQ